MKRLIWLVVPLVISCSTREEHFSKYKFVVKQSNGSGWGWSESSLFCDSVSQLNVKEAEAWVDGKARKVFATNYLAIINNPYYK